MNKAYSLVWNEVQGGGARSGKPRAAAVNRAAASG